MKKYSLTIVGLITLVASQFVPAEELQTVMQAVGIILAWYGRWRQGDISIVGVK